MAPSLLRIVLALAVKPFLTASEITLDLSNWIGQLAPVIGNATLLDLSLPGAHDAMTYDLSTSISDGYEGIGPVLSRILHGVTPILAGHFIRQQGQTQGISIVDMLNAGIRFIDFRIMYSQAPGHKLGHKDWYCLHGCQTVHRAAEYLRPVRAWLDGHPKEVVVFWASRHGDYGATGTDQYPDTEPAQRQAFFQEVQAVFGGLLFDSSKGRLNETSLSELWRRNERLVWYAADFVESTNSSFRALDARSKIDLPTGGGWKTTALRLLSNGSAELHAARSQDIFLLMSMAQHVEIWYIEKAAEITFLPNMFGSQERLARRCAALFEIPNMTSWCPPALMDLSLLSNYYNQRVLEAAFRQGASDSSVDFPHAIYIDAIDHGGLIRTGTAKINPSLQAAVSHAGKHEQQQHESDGYAYAPTLVAANVRRLCRRVASPQAVCARLQAAVEAVRAEHPVRLWEDAEHGRHIDWPPMPPSSGWTQQQQLAGAGDEAKNLVGLVVV
ncbi:unnamed protein product [Polarella glacialis]|uniref:Phosphatidylinositol-specific phospholipase C X domain-containing protein n=1 Tax=Polarella glacialis TaxID=89957 RepID=A0A813H0J8_POLGL|nr:unnamed protein product [Polarella glacialis]CAE8742139.1 unnamed protein product [Polarella glacialis]